MSFLVTARKYRPAAFSEVVAQDHVVGTLLNSIRLQRIAHAYLFSGPRGVGKTTTARIFAKAINCPNAVDGEPCNTCVTCTEITEGRCIDIIEIDGASNNGVEQVRSIRDAARYLPTREKYKMYIIDEVHMLTGAAFNALLKTLEEPPPHVLFVFATTEPHKLPATVISRCQRYDFKRIAIDDIVGQLRTICTREGITAEDTALFAIAKKGDGSMRDSESIFDQVVAFSGADLTMAAVREVLHVVDIDTFFRVTDLITAQDTRGGFELANDVLMSGYDIQDFLGGLEEHYRNLLVVRSTGATLLIEAPEDVRQRYEDVARHFTEGDLLRLLRMTAEAALSVRHSAQPRLKFEVALIAMIRIDSTVSISDLLAGGGSAATPAPLRTPAAQSTAARSAAANSSSTSTAATRSAPPPASASLRVAEPPAALTAARSSNTKPAAAVATAAMSTAPMASAAPAAARTTTSATSMRIVDASIPPAPFFPPDADSLPAGGGAPALLREDAHAGSGLHDVSGVSAVAARTATPPPLVQLLIDGLGAAVLPGRQA
jgi:DNA polymerase III subunit gamma/tau